MGHGQGTAWSCLFIMIHEVVINHHQIYKLLESKDLANSFKVMIQRHITRSVTKQAPKSFLCRGRTHTTYAPQKHWYVVDLLEAIKDVKSNTKPSLWKTKVEFIVKKLQDFERRTKEKLEKDK